MTLGEYLKNQRELMNYSTRDITKLTKISGAYISQIDIYNIFEEKDRQAKTRIVGAKQTSLF